MADEWFHFLRRTRVETGGVATAFSLLAALLPKETPFAGSFSKPASCDFSVIFLRFEICVATVGRLTNVWLSSILDVVEMGSIMAEGGKRRDRLSGVAGGVSADILTHSCSPRGVLLEEHRIDLILLA